MTTTTTSLYRAILDGSEVTTPLSAEDDTGDGAEAGLARPAEGILYPRIEADTYLDRSGWERTRRAEMTVFGIRNAKEVGIDGGVVLFDTIGWFGQAGWRHFEIPEGTAVPDNLQMLHARQVSLNRAGTVLGRRYVIVPTTRMSLGSYYGALDNLARNAVVRHIELAG